MIEKLNAVDELMALKKIGFDLTHESPYADQLAYVKGQEASSIYFCKGHLFKPSPNGFLKISQKEMTIEEVKQTLILMGYIE